MTATTPIRTTQEGPGYLRVTFDNPPLNLFDPDVISGLGDLLDSIENDGETKVVVFDSADPDYYFSHVDLLRIGENTTPGPTGLPPWPDVAARLEAAPFVTIGSLRGRSRGVGSEFLLALDMRFASIERAVLCQPEIGFGFVPGGGGLERLPLVTGRSRAIEIIVGGDDFDATTAERYGWVNRALPDDQLDAFVDRLASRIATFDRSAIATAKKILNERGKVARGADQRDSEVLFTQLLLGDEFKRRMGKLLEQGLQTRGDLEMHLAEAIVGL